MTDTKLRSSTRTMAIDWEVVSIPVIISLRLIPSWEFNLSFFGYRFFPPRPNLFSWSMFRSASSRVAND